MARKILIIVIIVIIATLFLMVIMGHRVEKEADLRAETYAGEVTEVSTGYYTISVPAAWIQSSSADGVTYSAESIDEEQSVSVTGFPIEDSEESFNEAIDIAMAETDDLNPVMYEMTELNGNTAEVYALYPDEDSLEINAFVHHDDTFYSVLVTSDDISEFNEEDMLTVLNSFVITEDEIKKQQMELTTVETDSFTISLPKNWEDVSEDSIFVYQAPDGEQSATIAMTEIEDSDAGFAKAVEDFLSEFKSISPDKLDIDEINGKKAEVYVEEFGISQAAAFTFVQDETELYVITLSSENKNELGLEEFALMLESFTIK